ncbi:unnamed protein product [Leptidea sinapis]|uniref:Uncharacterized protein n=1 Tax=Leptidea sinapis TaxID=189913 RepID=A0A5E4R5Q6_9NEOP|nr:unnamed protein product [Leptidea sinapis]
MFVVKSQICLLFLILYSKSVQQQRFTRTVVGIGYPYYNISMTLGMCRDKIIFYEDSFWPAIRLNRIMDIYYKSENENVIVTCADMAFIINNTDCLAYSDTGVGGAEFAATVFFATNMGPIFYRINLYTCRTPKDIL